MQGGTKYSNVRLERGDVKLIKTQLPKNPCDKCSNRLGCFGCPKGVEYQQKLKPMKDAGVLQYCLIYNRLLEINRIKQELDIEKRKLKEELSSIGVKL